MSNNRTQIKIIEGLCFLEIKIRVCISLSYDHINFIYYGMISKTENTQNQKVLICIILSSNSFGKTDLFLIRVL